MVLFVLICWVGGFGLFFRDILFWQPDVDRQLNAAERLKLQQQKEEKRRDLAERLRAVMASEFEATSVGPPTTAEGEVTSEKSTASPEKNSEKEIVAGWTSIVDPWDRQVTRFRSAATAGGWVAIPTRASLAGTKWLFYEDFGRETSMENGLWDIGDGVGLWLIKAGEVNPVSAELVAWNEAEPVGWISVESQRKLNAITLSPVNQQPPFVICLLPGEVDEIGVLVQANNIVGWTFGQWLHNGYLWKGRPGNELAPQISVQSFYNETYSGGREEKFAVALALGESGHAEERLQAFVDAFRVEPKLRLVDTPYYLYPEEITKQVRILASQLIHGGNSAFVSQLFDGETLRTIGDISLFMDIVPAITATRGYENTIHEIETTGRAIVEQLKVSVPGLNDVHATLYQEWLQSLVTVGAVAEAGQVYEKAKAYYPEDPYLQLLGVEIALLRNNWQAAEELLYAREYPSFLSDRFQLLAKRISEMKGEDGKIVIRFSPGSNRIPLSASINQTLYQSFLVDTGASMLTIPSSTAQSLGLREVEGYHGNDHAVSTAGGVVSATEVMIDSIEIGGWTEYNVRALVLDIPDQPGVGLLGLNYLSRFQMDLNTNEGVLRLSPR